MWQDTGEIWKTPSRSLAFLVIRPYRPNGTDNITTACATRVLLQTRLSEVKQPVIPQNETRVWCEHNYCMMQKASICNSCLLHCRPLSHSEANRILHMTYGSSCYTQLNCLKWNNQLKLMQELSGPCWALISSWLVGKWPLGFIKISEPSIPYSINSFHNV